MTNEEYLKKAITELITGINIFMNARIDQSESSVFFSSSTYTPVLGFKEAKKAFTSSEKYFAALLKSSEKDFYFDGKWLLRHIQWLHDFYDLPYKCVNKVYEDKDASEKDFEQACSTYDSFELSVNRLIEVIKAIQSKDILVKWKPGTEPISLPYIDSPFPLLFLDQIRT